MPRANEDMPGPDNEDDLYAEWRCRQCGVCCGSTDGHPCEHLRQEGSRYYCEIYPNRLDYHKTVDGLPFRCVTIRRIIETTGGYPGCAYVQEFLRRRGAQTL
jgi:hypothetical protein